MMRIEELLERATEFDAGPPPHINGYLVEADDTFVEKHNHVAISKRGEHAWAITDHRYCLNKNGEWEYESLPSNREDEFIKRTRFTSVREAFDFWNKWRDEEREKARKEGMQRPAWADKS
jgi:hypothetical protein